MEGGIDEKEKNLASIKTKRKWKQVAEALNRPELEREEEEAGKYNELLIIMYHYPLYLSLLEHFLEDIQQERSIYNKKKLRNRFDEFGTEFTPFNMREELEEGNIDTSGHYVYHKRDD